MKNISVYIVMALFFAIFGGLSAQPLYPKGKVKVMAVKGKVIFKSKAIKKDDVIIFGTTLSAVNQLKFTSPFDWVKVIEINSKKTFNYFGQKRYACSGSLGTKDGGTFINNDLDLLKYFSRKSIFLFETDTLICHGVSIKSDTETVPVFQFTLNGVRHNKEVGRNDTIIIAHDQLFDFITGEAHSMGSFLVDSIRLIYYKKTNPQKQIIPELPYFHIYFLEDAISFMYKLGLSDNEIYIELTENYVDLADIMNYEKLVNLSESGDWLRNKIHVYTSKKK